MTLHVHINPVVSSVIIFGFLQGKRENGTDGEPNVVCVSQLQGKFDAVTIKGKRPNTSRLVSRKYLKLRSWWREEDESPVAP